MADDVVARLLESRKFGPDGSNDDGTWAELEGEGRLPAARVELPALLIWHPDQDAQEAG